MHLNQLEAKKTTSLCWCCWQLVFQPPPQNAQLCGAAPMFGKYNQWSAGTCELFEIKLWHTSLLASTMTIWPFWPGISVLFLARSSSHHPLRYLSISWVVNQKSKNPWCWTFFFNTSPDYDKELLPGLLDSTLWVRKACLHGIFPGLAGFA